MKKKDVFDALAVSRPVNTMAARVTSTGEHYEEKPLPPHVRHWKAPPPLRSYVDPSGTDFDLTGKKIGRFTVIGILDAPGDQRWVVRCTCGDYETRGSKAIKTALGGYIPNLDGQINYRCYNCAQQMVNQKRLATQGSRPVSDFVNPKSEPKPKKKRTPTEILVWWFKTDEQKAKDCISLLNRNGYRIVRATDGS